MTIHTAFITGTGFYTLPGLADLQPQNVSTPFGEVTMEVGEFGGQAVAFLPRHGKGHTISPSAINYRANLFALKQLGVRRILATSVSGSLVPEWGPGSLVLVDQFLNFTYGRAETFYPLDGKLAHVGMTDPYCATLHRYLLGSAGQLGIQLGQGATYACFNGPRFETRAEIEMVRRLGGHLVGQTNYPEVVLARELAMCYATVGVVSNYAAGLQPGDLTATEVMTNIRALGDQLSHLFAAALAQHPVPEDCACQHALDEAEL